MVYIWRNTIRKVLNNYLITVSYATVIEKWQRDCRPTKPPYSSRHPAPIEPGTPLFRAAHVNPFIGYRSQPEWGLSRDPPSLFTHSVAGRDRLPVYLSVSYNVWETSKTNEGVWKETTESAPTLQLSRVAIGKRHKKWHITAGSDNVRFRRDANISNSELRQLRRRTPGDRCKSYVIRDCVRKRMTVYFYIW